MIDWIKAKTARIVLFITLILPVLPAFAERDVQVLASIRPLQLVINDLAGGLVESKVLIEGASSPHHFALRISDRRKIQQADLVVWVGPNLERFLEEVLAQKETRSVLTLSRLPGLSWPEGSGNYDHDHAIGDPHVWLSLHNIRVFARAFVDRLARLRPELAGPLNSRLQEFDRRLVELDTQAKQAFANPDGAFAAYHDGFGHFTQAYQLKQLAALTKVPEEQISARRLAHLKAELQEANCLMVDVSEAHTGERYANVLALPLVRVDLLATDKSATDFATYYKSIIDAFTACLNGPAR